MSIIIADQHFHTPRSDGILNREYRIEQIRKCIEYYKAKVLAIRLDHDIALGLCTAEQMGVNDDEFFSCMGAEVSTYARDIKFHAHLGLYAPSINHETHDALESIRDRKQFNYLKNIEILKTSGFLIDIEAMYRFQEISGGGRKNINNFQLAMHVLGNSHNRKNAQLLLKREGGISRKFSTDVPSAVAFMKNFLKEDGVCSSFGRSDELCNIGLEPGVLGELAEKNDGIVCLVHPHVTFQNIEEFLQYFPIYYNEYGVRAIEISTTMSLEWLEAILSLIEKPEYRDLIITFGSDSHGYDPDNTHGDLLKMNPFITNRFVNEKTRPFIERFCQ